MAATKRVFRLLLPLIIFGAVGVLSNPKYYKTGSTLTLNPALQGKPENIQWKHNNDKVVEDDDWYKFKDRARLDHTTGELTLQNLKPSDNGKYQSEIQVDKKLKYSSHQVVVMDPVSKPKVICEPTDQNIQLCCVLEPIAQSTFNWIGPGGYTNTNQNISISRATANESAIYECIVENKVSRDTAEIRLEDCIGGSVMTKVIVFWVLLVLFVLFAIGGVLGPLCRNRIKACRSRKYLVGKINIEEGKTGKDTELTPLNSAHKQQEKAETPKEQDCNKIKLQEKEKPETTRPPSGEISASAPNPDISEQNENTGSEVGSSNCIADPDQTLGETEASSVFCVNETTESEDRVDITSGSPSGEINPSTDENVKTASTNENTGSEDRAHSSSSMAGAGDGQSHKMAATQTTPFTNSVHPKEPNLGRVQKTAATFEEMAWCPKIIV